jgi:type I restriction enzyme S subunit
MRLRRKWPARLVDVLAAGGLFKGGRLTRIACEPPHGVDLLSQRDVFAIRPIPRRIQGSGTADLTVSGDMILMASRGQMNEGALFGKVERAAHMPAGAIITEDIMRLIPADSMGAPLFAFLSTTVGEMLLRTAAYGTSIPGMLPDLLLDLPVPDLKDKRLRDAGAHVEVATKARIEAVRAEVEAIRIIEEEVLPAWLA